MNPQDGTSQPQGRKLPVIHIVLLTSLLALCGAGVWSGRAQSGVEERKFEDLTSSRVPIKVKLKNEQAFKRMGNKDWARDLEVEIKNTGNKPIYFMVMNIDMPDVFAHEHPLVFQVSYGRKELVRLMTRIESDDVPIRPGDSITLKVSESQVKAYEKFRDEEKKADPKRVKLNLQLINFGDGTGLIGHKGDPLPNPARKQSRNIPKRNENSTAGPPAREMRPADSSGDFLKTFFSPVPANSLRVNFYPLEDNFTPSEASSMPDLCGCQNAGSCFYGVIDYASCPCDDPHQFFAFVFAGSCNSPIGTCRHTETVTRACDTQYNGRQFCTFQEDTGMSCAIGDPTPTPEATPTPTPTPTPSPIPCPEPEPNECCICVPPSAVLNR